MGRRQAGLSLRFDALRDTQVPCVGNDFLISATQWVSTTSSTDDVPRVRTANREPSRGKEASGADVLAIVDSGAA